MRITNSLIMILLAIITITVNAINAYITHTEENEQFTYPTIRALVNSSVGLPCNITTASSSDAVTLILWYRGGDISGAPIYSVDARDSTPIASGKHFTSDALKGRSVLDLSVSSVGILLIDSIADSDDGQYWCRVDFRWTRTVISVVTLTVIVPPKYVTVKNGLTNATLLNGSFISVNEHSDLHLFCDSYGGRPTPVVNWYRRSVIIDDTYARISSSVRDTIIVRNALTIHNISRTDLNTVLRCLSANSNLTQPIDIYLTIDVNLRPLTVEIMKSDSSDNMISGHETQIVCRSIGSRPSAQLVWLLTNTHRVTSDMSQLSLWHNRDNKSESVLKFVPSFADNGSQLRCRAINYLMPNSSVETAIKLNVKFAPVITLSLGSVITSRGGSSLATSGSIEEGSEILIHCEVSSNPNVSYIRWSHNLQPMFSNDRKGIIIANNNTTLIISSADRDTNGDYQCTAGNSMGETRSNSLQIDVLFSPKCVTTKTQRILSKIGDYVTMECIMTAKPENVTYYWSLKRNSNSNAHKTTSISSSSSSNSAGDTKTDNTIIKTTTDSNKFVVKSFSLHSYAKYQIEDLSDFGLVTCVANNQISGTSVPCVWNVSSIYQNVTLNTENHNKQNHRKILNECQINPSFTSVIVHCDTNADYFNDTAITFNLQLYDSAQQKLLQNTTNHTNPVFSITNLTADTIYMVKISAKTTNNFSQLPNNIIINDTKKLFITTKSFNTASDNSIITSLSVTTNSENLLLHIVITSVIIVGLIVSLVSALVIKLVYTSVSQRQKSVSKRSEIVNELLCDNSNKLCDISLIDIISSGAADCAADSRKLCNGGVRSGGCVVGSGSGSGCGSDDTTANALSIYYNNMSAINNGKHNNENMMLLCHSNKSILKLCCDDESNTTGSNRSSSTLETVATIESHSLNYNNRRQNNYFSTAV